MVGPYCNPTFASFFSPADKLRPDRQTLEEAVSSSILLLRQTLKDQSAQNVNIQIRIFKNTGSKSRNKTSKYLPF